jgi:adenylate cyclase
VAILASDVVGYSRLAGADEDRILARLRALRSDLIDPTIAVHNGRVVKRTGDGSIVEFRSVVDAVRCAIEVQNAMVERNAGVAEDRRIVFRIGIHLGDVVEESDGDLMGDGVNIAARLEGVAAPGAICLSEDAYRQVKGRLDLAVTDLGPTQLKNIADPIRAYSLQVGPSATKAVPRPEPAASTSVGKWSAVAALVLAIIVGAGWWGWNSRFVAISGPPTIAVLPLANMSGDPGLQYIADGTTENLIATLSRSPQIKVVARTSTDAYKGKSVDIRQIGKELGARYVVEGSVQKSADKLRIVAQLIDARNGEHVWAEHFDRQSSDPLALQDEVTDSIVKTLAGDSGLIKKKQSRALGDAWGPDSRLRLSSFAETAAGIDML